MDIHLRSYNIERNQRLKGEVGILTNRLVVIVIPKLLLSKGIYYEE